MKCLWCLPLGGIIGVMALAPGWLELPCTLEAPGKVVPQREWVLVRGPDGQLISTLSDHLSGRTESCAVVAFDRGDYGTFHLHPTLAIGAAVALGDTIGQIYSHELERQLADLRGQLATELASLALARTGEKESVIQEARLRLEQARLQAEQQRREVTRLQALFDQNLVAGAELEIAMTTLKVQELQFAIAAAQLQTAQTGAREAEVEWIRTRTAALQEELDLLERRAEIATLCAPLRGRFAGAFSGDTLAVIQDTAAYVVLMPVRWTNRSQLAPGQTVELQIEGSAARPTGAIEYLDRIARTALDGRQFLSARVLVADSTATLVPGLVVRCAIHCPPVSLIEYLWNFLSS